MEALGAVRALVVHGADGQDEISTTGPTDVAELQVEGTQARIVHYRITPEQFGIQPGSMQELRAGSPVENAAVAQEVLSGKKGAVRDAVLMNAAAALYVAGAAQDIAAGLVMAAESVDQRKARETLENVCKITAGHGSTGSP